MLKRISIIIIAVAAVLTVMVLLSGAVLADFEISNYDSQVDVEVSSMEPSSYIINIPAHLDISDGASYTFTASYINITEDEMVVVNASNLDAQNCLQLTNGTKTIKKRFVRSDVGYGVDQNCAAVFDGNGTTSLVRFYFENPENEAIPKAGYYTGTISFDVFVTGRG